MFHGMTLSPLFTYMHIIHVYVVQCSSQKQATMEIPQGSGNTLLSTEPVPYAASGLPGQVGKTMQISKIGHAPRPHKGFRMRNVQFLLPLRSCIFLCLGRNVYTCITHYSSTVYIGITMVFVFSSYMRNSVSSQFDF